MPSRKNQGTHLAPPSDGATPTAGEKVPSGVPISDQSVTQLVTQLVTR